VGDASLKGCIREIRRVLGDPAEEPRFIATVHRRGYRFLPAAAGDSEPVGHRGEAGGAAAADVLEPRPAARPPTGSL
jgi:DNA-binding winged helix-turn-helix (wHTH) protein